MKHLTSILAMLLFLIVPNVWADQNKEKDECIEARFSDGPWITSTRFWLWDFQFKNTCDTAIEVAWEQRYSDKTGWISDVVRVGPGFSVNRKAWYDMNEAVRNGHSRRPANPFVRWCAVSDENDCQSEDRTGWATLNYIEPDSETEESSDQPE